MATVIRLSRTGRKNRPHYRVGVFDRRTRRDGPPIEYLGHYDPLIDDADKRVVLDDERVRYWLGQGSLISETVRSFAVKRGIEIPRGKRRSKKSSEAPKA